jgi:ribonuclease HI
LLSAAKAEAHACAEAMAAAAGWGMTNVHIESDSQNLIRAIQSKDYDLDPEGVIYRDIRLSLSLSFDSVYC